MVGMTLVFYLIIRPLVQRRGGRHGGSYVDAQKEELEGSPCSYRLNGRGGLYMFGHSMPKGDLGLSIHAVRGAKNLPHFVFRYFYPVRVSDQKSTQ
jgi:hypothetical protein